MDNVEFVRAQSFAVDGRVDRSVLGVVAKVSSFASAVFPGATAGIAAGDGNNGASSVLEKWLHHRGSALPFFVLGAGDQARLASVLLEDMVHTLFQLRRRGLAMLIRRNLARTADRQIDGEFLTSTARIRLIAETFQALADTDLGMPNVDGWPVFSEAGVPKQAVNQVSALVTDREPAISLDDLAEVVLARFLLDPPYGLSDDVDTGEVFAPMAVERLELALGLMCPPGARAEIAALYPWAATLAASVDDAVTAAERAALLLADGQRTDLGDSLLDADLAAGALSAGILALPRGAPPPTPPPTDTPVWETDTGIALPGDIRWASDSPTGRRAPVLVVPTGGEDQGEVEVIPLDTYTFAATTTDVVLRKGETELGTSLRAVLSLQRSVSPLQIGARIGQIRDSLLQGLCAGTLPEGFYGSSPASPEDPRLLFDESLDAALGQLLAPLPEGVGSEAEPQPLPAILLRPRFSFIPRRATPEALAAAAAPSIIVGRDSVDDAVVVMDDPTPQEAMDSPRRRAEIRLRLGRQAALLRHESGDSVRLRSSKSNLPAEQFARVVIADAGTEGDVLNADEELLVALERILEWAA